MPPPLHDYLGDFTFYLDFYTRQSPSGIELRGPQRWRIKANWKIGAENFAGDMYHTPHTHASVVEIGLFREPKAEKRKEGATVLGRHTAAAPPTSCRRGGFDERLRYVGYPDEMIEPDGEDAGRPSQQRVIGDDGFMISAATVFPNLSFVHNWPQVDGAATTCCRSSRCGSGSRSARTKPRCCPGSRSTPRHPEEFKRTRTRPI